MMAQVHHPCAKQGLVVGLCPDTTVYLKLAREADESGFAPGSLRAAGKIATIHAVEHGLADADRSMANAWRESVIVFDHGTTSAVDEEPLLKACLSCISTIPTGGAPWQGSWRSDTLREVLRALDDGAILLAVEAHSLDERRSWARMLLKSGCAFVQTHEDAH